MTVYPYIPEIMEKPIDKCKCHKYYLFFMDFTDSTDRPIAFKEKDTGKASRVRASDIFFFRKVFG